MKRPLPMNRPLPWLAALLALLIPLAASAQQGLEIDIVGGNASAIPIAVIPMQGPATLQADVAKVVAADLNRSGSFRSLPDQDIVERPSRGGEVNYPTWAALNQDYILVGRVLDAGNGGYRVEYELFDVAKKERLLGYRADRARYCPARCRPPDRRRRVREDHRHPRRLLHPHRLRHRHWHRQGLRVMR